MCRKLRRHWCADRQTVGGWMVQVRCRHSPKLRSKCPHCVVRRARALLWWTPVAYPKDYRGVKEASQRRAGGPWWQDLEWERERQRCCCWAPRLINVSIATGIPTSRTYMPLIPVCSRFSGILFTGTRKKRGGRRRQQASLDPLSTLQL